MQATYKIVIGETITVIKVQEQNTEFKTLAEALEFINMEEYEN
jgi:hypothetical protein